jgi:hypothetical protein
VVTLRDANGLTCEVAAGDLDAASHFLTAGQCHSFAVALAEKTGWPIVEFWAYEDEDDEGHVAHFAVLSPDATILDGDPPLPLHVVEGRTGWEHRILGSWNPAQPGPSPRDRVLAIVESERACGRVWQPLDTDLVSSFVDPAVQRLAAA